MKSTAFAVLAAVLALQGCDSKPPACSDEATLGLVKQIWNETVEKNSAQFRQGKAFASQIETGTEFKVTAVRTNQYNDQSKKYLCDAVAELKIPKDAVPALDDPMFKATVLRDSRMQNLVFNGNVIKNDVQFTSQMTDDGKEHLVEITGHQPLVDVAYMVTMYGAFRTPTSAQ